MFSSIILLAANSPLAYSHGHIDPDSFNLLQVKVHTLQDVFGEYSEEALPNILGSPVDKTVDNCRWANMSESDKERAKAIFYSFVNRTRSEVMAWPVSPAMPNTTDRVAVVLFQPAHEVDAFAWSIRWNSRMLGPKWALQVFYATEEDRSALDKALGKPSFLIWTPIRMRGMPITSMNRSEFNWFMSSTYFWEPLQHEHVLYFETDSMLLRHDGCVEDFLHYDYVGAPWPAGEGGNGGLGLHRRSTTLKAVRSDEAVIKQLDKNAYETADFQADSFIVHLLQKLNASFAPREEAKRFSVETIDDPAPCGLHKRWGARCDEAINVENMMVGYMLQAQSAML